MIRNYAREYKNYHSTKKQKIRRASRNKARRIMKKTLGSKINGKDIHHKDKNPFNNKSLRQNIDGLTYNKSGKPKKHKKVDNIITLLKNKKY